MGSFKEMPGDIFSLAKSGKFDVIVHGCNCFCRMKRGIAPRMAEEFCCDEFPLEHAKYVGNIQKLGKIDFRQIDFKGLNTERLTVVNAYTQYHWKNPSKYGFPLDYDAMKNCFRYMNYRFRGMTIGMPRIGCGLAGGHWEIVKALIQKTLKDCNVIVVNYEH